MIFERDFGHLNLVLKVFKYCKPLINIDGAHLYERYDIKQTRIAMGSRMKSDLNSNLSTHIPFWMPLIWLGSLSTPSNACGVLGFLGLTRYYKKFIHGFAIIVALLTYLLTKEAFCWTPEVETAFHRMKIILTYPPDLQLQDFSTPFVVECYASSMGFYAILTQHNRPIAFYSEALNGSTLALSTYKKEMLAIVKRGKENGGADALSQIST
ncbi:hypothetical protein SADUNF_Sadunf13G0069100 [Salix dunnii]|uniref:Reverse transcriptase/retrotransposon-derived protein RNase H-like domain-containing protein n=1 Tax=Salix dunnii TaxID=1413687 RepID=A0A835JL62_9ROSI|nr:hypothetical protein SADUNF_Sadunf13G0069100 [Salix dunnii]